MFEQKHQVVHSEYPKSTRCPWSTVVIGLGNPILGDDGVGWVVAQEVERRLSTIQPLPATVECLSLAGIALMEQMVGRERVILVDAMNTGQRPQGEVVSFSLDSLEELVYGHSASAHDLSLKNALELGRRLGADLPRDDDIQIVAIEAGPVYDFGEHLSPDVTDAVPNAVDIVMRLLEVVEGEKEP